MAQADRSRDVLGTKLYPPKSSIGLVKRDRLVNLVSSHDDLPRLAKVIAPAGYGKSTVLSQWWEALSAADTACCWVSLDPDDNDPARFLSYVVAALRPLFSDSSLAKSLDGGVIESTKIVLRALVKNLETLDHTVAIFLDDYHVIDAPEIDALVDWLLANAPDSASFFVASRVEPDIAVSDLKLKGRLLDLGASDLNFQLRETRAFLNCHGSLDLDDRAIEVLLDRTEGWIAGIQLASLAMHDLEDKQGFLDEFTGDDRDVIDYLGAAVLKQQSVEIRDFLLRTSVVDRMCAALCAELTGFSSPQEMLEILEKRSLFLFPLDRDRHWYRYHHLFSDFLRNRFFALQQDEAKKCCLIASNWFDENGFSNEAVRCGFLSQDLQRTGDLIAQYALPISQYRGEHATLLKWIDELPPEYTESRPHIHIGLAWTSIFTRRYTEASSNFEKLLAHCENLQNKGTTADKCRADEIRCSVEMMKCVQYAITDNSAVCRRNSADWLVRWSDAIPFNKGTVGNALGYACLSTFEFDLGRKALAEARLNFERVRGHYGVAWADAILGMLCMRQGCLSEAGDIYERGLEYTDKVLGPLSYAGTMLSLLYAETLYERNLLDEAAQRLEPAFGMIHEHGSLDMAVIGYSTMARLRFNQGKTEEALAVLADGERLGRAHQQPSLSLYLTGVKVQLLIRAGDTAAARSALELAGFFDWKNVFPEDQRDVTREVPRLALIRLGLAEGETVRAAPHIKALLSRARQTGRKREIVELLTLSAVASKKGGRNRGALRCLGEALQLAFPEGYQRVFLDAGSDVQELIRQIVEKRKALPEDSDVLVPADYLESLVEGSDAVHPAPHGEAQGASVPAEKLTKREQQILQLIDCGMANAELAESLFISEQTAKWHLHNIYGKLGVHNRTGALARARNLHMI